MKTETGSERLRKHAEEMIRRKAEIPSLDAEKMTPEKTWQTLYELRVHQIELELQNEELRCVQAELEVSKARYFDFYNLAPVGYCTMSTAGLLRELNLTFATMLELVSSKLIGKPFNQFVLSDDQDLVYLLIKALLATGETQTCELRLVKADQTTFWVKLIASLASGAHGTVECRLVVTDINEHKLNEEKLIYSKSLLLTTLEASEEGIFAVDANRNLSIYNRNFSEMWNIEPTVLDGCNEEQIQKLCLLQIADQEKMTSEMRENFNSSVNVCDEEIRLIDGRTLVRTIKRQKLDGIDVGRVLSFRDITERKRVEDALSESEERFRKLFERHAAPMLTIEPGSGAITDANQAAADLYGWSITELRQMNILQLGGPEIMTASAPHGAAVLDGSGVELLQRMADGTLRDVEIFSNRIVISGKEVLYSVVHDITGRKLAEADLVYLSFHDALTGLYNRRYFEEELLRMDTVRQLPISIISGDVNSLKLINDVFGHAAGDELIVTVARIMKDCCRAEDVVVRFGGDEFVVVLPKCDEATAGNIIERIKMKCLTETIQGISVSVALGSASKTAPDQELSTVVNMAETRMYKNKFSAVNRVRLDTLEALERTVYEKDNTEEHAERMLAYATQFGEYLQLPTEALFDLTTLSTVHDIGKIAISEQLLNKSEKLSAKEWEELKTHPVMSNRILRATRMVSFNVEEAALAHHEHWDGGGYPNGLKATAIPLLSRIIAIIDAYDVMTHDRPYQTAITHEGAKAELQRCAGTQFDPELVAEFVEFIGAGGE